MNTTLFFIIGACCVVVCLSQCPTPRHLSDKGLCAAVFEHASTNRDKSCRGQARYLSSGHSTRYLDSGFNDKISSLVVAPGCVLSVWEHSNRDGDHKRFFTDIHTHLWQHRRGSGFWSWDHWSDVISSYSCSCRAAGPKRPH